MGRYVCHQCARAFPDVARGDARAAQAQGKDHQHRIAGRNPTVGEPCALLCVEGSPAHADGNYGEGFGAGYRRELRGPRHDRCAREKGLRESAQVREEDTDATEWNARGCRGSGKVLCDRTPLYYGTGFSGGWGIGAGVKAEATSNMNRKLAIALSAIGMAGAAGLWMYMPTVGASIGLMVGSLLSTLF